MASHIRRYLCFVLLPSAISCDREPPLQRLDLPTSRQESSPPPAAEELIPPGAEKMRVHWELKLPSMAKCQGNYCFRDRESFAGLLDRASSQQPRVSPYEKWNGIDFSRQMALLVADKRSSGGFDVKILRVWKCASEIIVEVLELIPGPESVVTHAFTYPWASAVVNRSELPVRFLRRTRIGAEAEPPSR